jgi:hypothetical protein
MAKGDFAVARRCKVGLTTNAASLMPIATLCRQRFWLGDIKKLAGT